MSDPPLSGKRIIFVANTDWHLFNFRLPIAHEARRRGAEVLLVSPPGPYVERLRDAGFEHVAVALRQRGMNPLRDVAFAGRLRRLYRRTRPDMVHHFSVKPVIYGSLAARYRGGPVVVNAVPGLGYAFAGGGGMKRLLVRGVVSALYGSSLRGEGVWTIFQNEEDRELFLRRDWISMTRAYMIAGSGVDSVTLLPDPAARSPEPSVLFVGRLLWDKGLGDLVEALRNLRATGNPVRCRVAGAMQPDHAAAIPEAVLRAWEADGLVEILGHRADVHDLIRSAWVIALPTRYGEGVPKSLLEAAALGCPIVTTDVPGCRDIARQERSGILTAVGDVRSLASALRRVLGSPDLRDRLAANARQLFEERFDIGLVLDQTMKVYHAALSSSSGGRASEYPEG